MRSIAGLLIAFTLVPSIASAAIAFDATVHKSNAASPNSTSFTATGSDIVLVVCVFTSDPTNTGNSVTFNGATLTRQATVLDTTGNTGPHGVWSGAVTAGTDNIVVTTPAGSSRFSAASYTGVLGGTVAATTTVDAYNRPSGSLTTTFTTTESNTWTVLCAADSGGAPVAGTGSTARQTGVFPSMFDSNGAVTSPYNMNFTWSASVAPQRDGSSVGVVLSPNAPAAGVSPFVQGAAWWFAAW